MKKINLEEKFNLFQEHWSPKIVGELNGQQVKLVKLQGEFVWHSHEQEDELFYVVKGVLKMELRNETIELQEGEMMIVQRGIEHKPVAEKEVWVLLFEPASTLNTGNLVNERTRKELDVI
ncbi:MAG: cupin domain-containing protein [Flavisolibacter sp.]